MARSRVSRRRAFTLIELLVVVLIIAVLIAVALPSFLGETDKAQDSAAQQYLTYAWKDAHALWVSDGSFPTDASGTTGTLEAQLHASEPELTFQQFILPTSSTSEAGASTGPRDISVIDSVGDSSSDQADGPNTVALCNKSDSGRFYCIRAAALGGLDTTAQDAAYQSTSASAHSLTGSLKNLLSAQSASAATADAQNPTFSKTTGASQLDAFCALASATAPAGSSAPGSCPSGVTVPDCPTAVGWSSAPSGTCNSANGGGTTPVAPITYNPGSPTCAAPSSPYGAAGSSGSQTTYANGVMADNPVYFQTLASENSQGIFPEYPGVSGYDTGASAPTPCGTPGEPGSIANTSSLRVVMPTYTSSQSTPGWISSTALTGSFTVEAWVKPESLNSEYYNIAAELPIVNAGATTGFSMDMVVTGSEYAPSVHEIQVTLNGKDTVTVPYNWSFGDWYQVAAVVNSTADTLDVYVNGTDAQTSTFTVAQLGGSPEFPQDWGIGADGLAGETYSAYIDDISVYGTALSDIGAHYHDAGY